MLMLWGGGASLQLGLLAWQLLRLRRIQRAGVPWLEGRDLARMLAAECGVRGTVDVLLHEEIPAPVTCGVLRPVILLPFDVTGWSEDDLRRAFIHELEHVRRGDWARCSGSRASQSRVIGFIRWSGSSGGGSAWKPNAPPMTLSYAPRPPPSTPSSWLASHDR